MATKLTSSNESKLQKTLVRASKATSQADIATAAEVSTRTVSQILKSKFATNPSPASPKISAKQLKGYIEALTRLSVYFALDPIETIRDYNIDPELPGVSEIIDSVRRKHSPTKSDRIISRIHDRGNIVRVGIFDWQPWKRPNEPPRDSWAYKYLKRLLGSVNPDYKLEVRSITSIQDIFNALSYDDIFFGGYDTPYRRLRGLEFIHVPGLGVPLSGLTIRTEKLLDWTDVLDNSIKSRGKISLFVVDQEVGHLFLAGASSNDNAFTVIAQADRTYIASEFLSAARDPSIWPILIADQTSIIGVMDEIKALSGPSEDADLQNIVELTDGNLRAPVYRLGIAVPADAVVFKELLETAQREELFQNAYAVTAQSYVELLIRRPRLRCIPFGPEIHAANIASFARCCDIELQKLRDSDERLEKTVEAVKKEMDTQWFRQSDIGTLESSLKKLSALTELLTSLLQDNHICTERSGHVT